jgi:hypothetical protein
VKRYRDDSVKPGRGIDGTKGENWTKANASDDVWNLPNPSPDRSYSRNSSKSGDKFVESGADSQNLLRQGPQDVQFRWGKRDIVDDVIRNASNNPEDGFSAAIRYGIDRLMSDGTQNSSH